MTVLLVESRPDPASRTIAARLRARPGWQETPMTVGGETVLRHDGLDARLVATDLLHLEAEELEAQWLRAALDPQAVVFLSKHKAASGRPALTVHPVGNWGEARFGGRPGRASPAASALQSELLRALDVEARRAQYPAEVTFEVTHHGPLLIKPACFLELGSSEAQWTDERGAEVIVRALESVLSRPLPRFPTFVGLGGGHYGPRFGEIVRNRGVHVGHMVPAHAAEVGSPEDLLAESMDKTPGAEGLYLHANSLSEATLAAWKVAAKARGVAWLGSDAWAKRPLPSP